MKFIWFVCLKMLNVKCFIDKELILTGSGDVITECLYTNTSVREYVFNTQSTLIHYYIKIGCYPHNKEKMVTFSPLSPRLSIRLVR